MKKVLVGVIVLGLLLAVAPFAIGKLAEKRIERGLDQLVLEAPFLRIAERKYRVGWFSSELDVTFELFSGVGLGPASSIRLHHDISHGPVLGSGIGLARIKTHFELDPSTRQELAKIFGDEEPFDISTHIAFSGGATTVVSSDAHEYESEGAKMAWDALKLVIETSSNGDSYKVDGKWPRFEGHSTEGSEFAVRGMRVSGTGKRLVGNLFDTDLEFAIDDVSVTSPQETYHIEDIHYVAATEPHEDLIDLGLKMGTGAFKSNNLNLTEAHYDFTVQRLHAATFDKLMTAMKTAYSQTANAAAQGGNSLLGPYKEQALELLRHDPVLVIDRMGFSTEDGTSMIKGTIRLKGVTAEDLEVGSLGLITRVVADLDIDVSETMLAKLSGSGEAAEGVVKQGLAERKEGHLLSKVLFQDGKLLINGKEQAIPGLGGPQPASPTSPE